MFVVISFLCFDISKHEDVACMQICIPKKDKDMKSIFPISPHSFFYSSYFTNVNRSVKNHFYISEVKSYHMSNQIVINEVNKNDFEKMRFFTDLF